MATNEIGVHYPQGTDSFAPHTDMKALADSLPGRVIVPVANATERNALSSAMSAAGHNFALEPLMVYRTDIQTVEVTAGAGWGELYSTALLTSDTGFPSSTPSLSSEIVTNRITVPAAPFRRVVNTQAGVYLTSSQTAQVEAVLYAGAVVLQRNRRTLTADVGETLPMSGSFVVNAGASAVIEVRHRRMSGTGNVIPSVGSLNTLWATVSK